MDMQEAYAKADLERLQRRVYDLLAETERLRAELNLSRGCCQSLQDKVNELQAALQNRAF